MKHSNAGTGTGIRAGDVLDVPESAWSERPWVSRRELGGEASAFCDKAASHALAIAAGLGAASPEGELFLERGNIQAWRGDFSWGRAWCASRGGEFWAWARETHSARERLVMGGPIGQWDEEAAEIFGRSLAPGLDGEPS